MRALELVVIMTAVGSGSADRSSNLMIGSFFAVGDTRPAIQLLFGMICLSDSSGIRRNKENSNKLNAKSLIPGTWNSPKQRRLYLEDLEVVQ
jgi:hypothetical protein